MFEYTVRLTILIKMWFDVNDNWPGEMDKLTQKQTKALASRIQRNKQVKQVKNISKKLEKPRDQQTSIRSDKASFKSSIEQKLSSSKFRWLNEQMYTQHSSGALKMFTESPKLFSVYHQGFTLQTQKWPVNPLDRIISHLNTLPADLLVVDLGCGEARLALEVEQKVLSFDLLAVNSRVTACDMRDLPVETATAHVAVFCLALMGTNILEFLTEARRVLRHRGELMIAEISSRFEDIDKFISSVEDLNFKLESRDDLTDMFTLIRFRRKRAKFDSNNFESELFSLKPCLYKKR